MLNRKKKSLLSASIAGVFTMISLLQGYTFSKLYASAYDKGNLQSQLIQRLYNGGGGRVSCDFDGYVNTPGRHEGIDFAKGSGSPVYSLIDGIVINVVNTNSSSSLSTLSIYDSKNDKTVIYLHTANICVEKGSTISIGQQVATESDHGAGGSPHTHVEVRNGQRELAAKSVNDPTLDNDNPYPYWDVIFNSNSNRIDTPVDTSYNTNVSCTAPSKIYTYDMYGNLEGNRWVDKDDPCIAIEAYATGFWKIDYPSGSTRRQAYMKLSEWNPFSKLGHNPVGYLDGAAGGNGTVTVSGWAYDADTPNEAVEIHIYMDGEAGTGTCVATGIIADKERPDVNNAGYPGNHGFEATIDISDTGTHTFYAHAINRGAAGEGFPNTLLTNNWSTTISELIPHGAEMSSGAGQTIADGYYGIYSHLAENYYLDIDGADVPPANGTNVHMWKHDNNGLPMCDVWEVRYVDNGFYTIKQMNSDSVLDACGADTTRGTNVQAHTSNGSNAQLWSIFPQNSGYKIQAKCSGYYLDVAGGLTEAGTNVHLWEENETAAQMWSLIPYDEDAPLISDVKVTDVTSKGYTVQCTVNDVGKSGIDRVQFPTWTAENEQDDLLADWSSNSRASGTIDGNKVTFTVNISDHNSEWGVYRTHIYAFDKCGNYTYVVVDDVFVSSQIVGDVNMDGELGVTDVILLQKWLLSASNTHLPNWQAADMYKDNKLNIFDLCLMKRKLLA